MDLFSFVARTPRAIKVYPARKEVMTEKRTITASSIVNGKPIQSTYNILEIRKHVKARYMLILRGCTTRYPRNNIPVRKAKATGTSNVRISMIKKKRHSTL